MRISFLMGDEQMNKTREIFVILIDGDPYRKNSAIRTYKTRERAESEAQKKLSRYWSYRNNKFEVGEFALRNIIEVPVEPRKDVELPMSFIPNKEDEV